MKNPWTDPAVVRLDDKSHYVAAMIVLGLAVTCLFFVLIAIEWIGGL